MGNRAVIQLIQPNGDSKTQFELSPVLYLHWEGSNVPALLELFHDKFLSDRLDDLQYGFARLVGHAVRNDLYGTTGFGVWNQPELITLADSQDDAGIFLVDISNKAVFYGGGYEPKYPAKSAYSWVPWALMPFSAPDK